MEKQKKTYMLLKDLPTHKANAIFVIDDNNELYIPLDNLHDNEMKNTVTEENRETFALKKWVVEGASEEWFKRVFWYSKKEGKYYTREQLDEEFKK